MFYRAPAAPLSVAGEAAAQKLFSFAQTLRSDNSPNLFGEWCIADLDLALMLSRLVLNGDAVPGRQAEYASHQWQRSPRRTV